MIVSKAHFDKQSIKIHYEVYFFVPLWEAADIKYRAFVRVELKCNRLETFVLKGWEGL